MTDINQRLVAPCPLCGARPNVGRASKRNTARPAEWVVFCVNDDHELTLYARGRNMVKHKWNELCGIKELGLYDDQWTPAQIAEFKARNSTPYTPRKV